jgi:hypothetical protein
VQEYPHPRQSRGRESVVHCISSLPQEGPVKKDCLRHVIGRHAVRIKQTATISHILGVGGRRTLLAERTSISCLNEVLAPQPGHQELLLDTFKPFPPPPLLRDHNVVLPVSATPSPPEKNLALSTKPVVFGLQRQHRLRLLEDDTHSPKTETGTWKISTMLLKAEASPIHIQTISPFLNIQQRAASAANVAADGPELNAELILVSESDHMPIFVVVIFCGVCGRGRAAEDASVRVLSRQELLGRLDLGHVISDLVVYLL